MNQNTQLVTDLSQNVLHVSVKEWPRIIEAWLIRFLYQVGYVIAWTMITALIVERFGIKNLPLLYIGHSLFVVLGSFVFRRVMSVMRNRTLLIYIATLCSIGVGATMILIPRESVWFILTLMFCLGVFFNQMYIGLLKFIESIFTPSENERIYPIIETAEPLGGTLAGFVLFMFAGNIHTTSFTYVWLGCALAMIPIILHFYRKKNRFIDIHTEEEAEQLHEGRSVRKGLSWLRTDHFIGALALVLFCHWMFVHILHFQFTKAINLDVLAHVSSSHAHHEDALTHGLGGVHMIFSLLMFFSQLLLSSRILKKLGTIGAMQIVPALSSITSTLMMFYYGYGTAVLAQGLYEANSIFFTQGYHHTYYAIGESIRERVREFLEAVIKPLGIISGTLLLFLYSKFFTDAGQNIAITVTLLSLSITNIITMFFMKQEYSSTVKKQLDLPGDHPEKLYAIDLLGQKGHESSIGLLLHLLHHPKESTRIKLQVLKALAHLNDASCLQDVLEFVDHPNKDIRLEALTTIATFSKLGSSFFSQAFSRYRVVELLTTLYRHEKGREMRSAIIRVFANIEESSIIPLLLKDLKSKSYSIQADALRLIGMFHDSSIVHFVEPYLESKNERVRAHAYIALWQFPHVRKRLQGSLQFYFSNAQEKQRIISGIYLIGETGQQNEYQRVLPFLHHGDWEVRAYAATALAKLGFESVLGNIIQLLLTQNQEVALKTHSLMKTLGTKMRRKLQTLLERHINALMRLEHGFVKEMQVHMLTKEQLERLHFFYTLLGFENELCKVELELEDRNK